MNEINFSFIDNLYLRFLNTPATEAQRLALGFIMESEGLSERQTTRNFIEDNLPNSLFLEYYIQFPSVIPTLNEVESWAINQGKTEAETLQLISLVAFDFYAIAANNINGDIKFTSQSNISTLENQIDLGLQANINSENISYSLLETSFGSDSGLFTIDKITGLVNFITPPDFESSQDQNGDNIYQITVVATNLLTKTDNFQNISITVNDNNDAPIIELEQSADYQENKLISETLMTVAASDVDSNIVDFAIVAGNNDGYFSIDNLGNISLTAEGINSIANDFETAPNLFTLSVTATDDEGLSSTATDVNLNVINKEERIYTLIGDTEVTEGGKVNYRVVLTGGDMSADSAVTLSFLLSNGTALNPADFGDLSQVDTTNHTATISGPFSDGDTIANFELLTVEDFLVEGDEDFTAALTGAVVDNNTATASGTINTTIIDNDFLSFDLTGSTSITEGGSAFYQIKLNGGNIAAGSTVTLSIASSNGSATSPADFGVLSQVIGNTLTLTGPFNDGDIVASLSLPSIDDTLRENTESFNVSLISANVDGNTVSSSGSVNTSIIDNDNLIFTLTETSMALVEGDTATYEVILSAGSLTASDTIVLGANVFSGTASLGTDFSLLSGTNYDSEFFQLTINGTFNTGDVVANLNVNLEYDLDNEVTEQFTVSLLGPVPSDSSITANSSIQTSFGDLPPNPISIASSADASNANALLTPGIDIVTIDLGGGNYTSLTNFNLSNFTDIDILKFNLSDGGVTPGSATNVNTIGTGIRHSSTRVTGTPGNAITHFDKIQYDVAATSVKLISNFTSVQISGLPSVLNPVNFIFF